MQLLGVADFLLQPTPKIILDYVSQSVHTLFGEYHFRKNCWIASTSKRCHIIIYFWLFNTFTMACTQSVAPNLLNNGTKKGSNIYVILDFVWSFLQGFYTSNATPIYKERFFNHKGVEITVLPSKLHCDLYS